MLRRWLAVLLTAASLFTTMGPMRSADAAGEVPILRGLNFPGDFTVGSDGTIVYAETYIARLSEFSPRTGRTSVLLTLPNASEIFGVAIHPTKGWIYFTAIVNVPGGQHTQLFRLVNGSVSLLVDFGPKISGGRLLFGPDGMLYLVLGDRNNSSNSQNLRNPFGKVLRMTDDGSPAPGNPIAGSRIFAYGIRNSFGMGFDPKSSLLWLTDNGPKCNDEIDLIRQGGNYGWGPTETCATPPPAPRDTNRDGQAPTLPVLWMRRTVAPTGLAFTPSGRLLYGTYNTRSIRQVTLNSNRTAAASDQLLLRHSDHVLSVERGGDGQMYFSDETSIYRLQVSGS